MKRYVQMTMIGALMVTIALGSMVSRAQDRGGGRGNFDPEMMRQRIMDRFQEQLNVSDDEWKVIQPLVEKVWGLQREARGGGFGRMFFRGRGGDQGNRPGRPGFGPPPSPEEEALQQALDKEDTPAADIKAKLTAYRDAKKKKQAELKKAQDDLRKVLTIRQEAMLVLMGTLD